MANLGASTISFFARYAALKLRAPPETEVNEEEEPTPREERNINYRQECQNAKQKYIESRDKLIVATQPLIYFIVGAIIGAVAMDGISFICLVIPIVFLLLLAFVLFVKSLPVENSPNPNNI